MRYVSHSNADFANLMANAKAYKAGDEIRNAGHSMSAVFQDNSGYLPPVGRLSTDGRDSLRAWTKLQAGGVMIMFIHSYWTIVGALNVSNGDYWMTDEKFSRTTSQHMNHIRHGVNLFRGRNT